MDGCSVLTIHCGKTRLLCAKIPVTRGSELGSVIAELFAEFGLSDELLPYVYSVVCQDGVCVVLVNLSKLHNGVLYELTVDSSGKTKREITLDTTLNYTTVRMMIIQKTSEVEDIIPYEELNPNAGDWTVAQHSPIAGQIPYPPKEVSMLMWMPIRSANEQLGAKLIHL